MSDSILRLRLILRLRRKCKISNMVLQGDLTNPDGLEAANQLEAQQAEIARLRGLLFDAAGIIGNFAPMDDRAALVGGALLNPKKVWKDCMSELFPKGGHRAALEQKP